MIRILVFITTTSDHVLDIRERDRSNKRRGTDGYANDGMTRRTGSDPASIDDATKPPDPHKLVGTRLEPIM